MVKALISGITGQDGSYLTEILLDAGYDVYGIIRRSSSFNTGRIDHLFNNPKLKLVYGDLADSLSIANAIDNIKPDYFYNTACQSHVRVSFEIPEYTCDVGALGVLRILETIKEISPKTRFLTCSSSEMFGSAAPPQNELTRFQPRSPYACAKVFGYYQTINYREAYNVFACNSICFNHESERRGETFVSRKITRALGRIKYGLQDELRLGNLEAKRDWGHAKDYCEAMKLIIEHDKPDDYVISTGNSVSVRYFLETAFNLVGLDPYKYVVIDPKYYRPAEVDYLLGDASKIRKELGWEPKIKIDELIKLMVEHDLELARKEHILKNS